MGGCLLYDTTLRDGSQAEGVSFSIADKIQITKLLDDFGVDYIEGGWPGSNPKDAEYFQEVSKIKLSKAKIAVFGSTKKSGIKAKDDANLKELVLSKADVACIFAKAWDLHVKKALQVSLDENLEIIYDSISFLKQNFSEVILDLEHFFDGYNANNKYSIEVIKSAIKAKADYLVLCDTNGGMLPWQVEKTIAELQDALPKKFGIHAHNDGELGVSNSLSAIKMGAKMVQGTVNGFGERCGNANLVSIIANAQLKMGIDLVGKANLKKITTLSRRIAEISNLGENTRQAFVGSSAFAHKGGIHVSAVIKDPVTYEHVDPSAIGNSRRVLVSELSGKSNLNYILQDWHWPSLVDDKSKRKILIRLKEKEHSGYVFEGATASLELFILAETNNLENYFDVISYRVIDERLSISEEPNSMATIKFRIGKNEEVVAAEGRGPVDALTIALLKGLSYHYSVLKGVKLTDYKVRILDGSKSTAAKVRVLISFGALGKSWNTVGVGYDIISASFIAVIDGIKFHLYANSIKNAPSNA